ncbi:hypothetical protein E6P97_04130 [Patescibacteria group bacterium]|nr:MAG: hypothetical protein E6P97_04130 [Patescibacteria group bacterium]
MSFRDVPKGIEVTLCERCPARRGEVFVAKLRGSSFRGRLINDGEEFSVDNCVFSVGDIAVANVQIANIDSASAEHDAEVLTSCFEANVKHCANPDSVLGDSEPQTFCAPINRAVDEFMKINYAAE